MNKTKNRLNKIEFNRIPFTPKEQKPIGGSEVVGAAVAEFLESGGKITKLPETHPDRDIDDLERCSVQQHKGSGEVIKIISFDEI